MKNVTTEVKNDKLVVTIDVSKAVLDAAEPSKTGKSHIVAGTSGFIAVQTPAGPVRLSLNAIR